MNLQKRKPRTLLENPENQINPRMVILGHASFIPTNHIVNDEYNWNKKTQNICINLHSQNCQLKTKGMLE